MRPTDNTKSKIKNMDFKASDELKEKILSDVLHIRNKQRHSAETPSIWRIIMQNKTATFTTAAAALILIMITVYNLTGSIDGTSVAWAEVVKQMNNYTKYKCRQRVVRNGRHMPATIVYHMNLSLRRQEVENGEIHIIDMRETDAITVVLYPSKRKAIVTKLLGFGPRKDPNIVEMVKRFEQDSTERLGTKDVDGKTLQGFRQVPNKYNDFTVWVDPETKLPVEIELIHTQRGQTIFMDEFEFDFELAPDAFSTEIPAGYEVETIINDYRSVEPKVIAVEDIRRELNHTAYKVGNLLWIEKRVLVKDVDPLGSRAIVYILGIKSDDGNTMLIVQGDYYDQTRMVWLADQQIVLETRNGAKLYSHPNGSKYSQIFLKSFAKVDLGLFDIDDLSEERLTRMIAMPDGTVLGLVANRQVSNEKLKELVESLTVIDTN